MKHKLILTAASLAFIILVLFILFVPNVHPGEHHRANINRTRNDQRIMGIALERYYADHQAYPIMVPLSQWEGSEKILQKLGMPNVMMAHPGSESTAGITTPVAYLEEYLPDRQLKIPFAYCTAGDEFMLYTPTSGHPYQIKNPKEIMKVESRDELIRNILPYAYDPTNGNKSNGDVWRIKQ